MNPSRPPEGEAAGGGLEAPASGFEIITEATGPRQVRLRVSGELDLATAPQLRSSLIDTVSHADEVVLDLGGVDFIDSTGLAAIIAGVNAAESAGAVFQLTTPLPPQPQRLLELTGVTERLSFTAAPPQR